MKLNHLNLTVTDVTETQQFLEKYFGLQNMGGNKNIGFLSDENGLILTLTNMKVGRETEVRYPYHVSYRFHSGERSAGE